MKSCIDVLDDLSIPRSQETNSWWVALCPRHDDHAPSLRVSPDGRGWKCFVCNAGGGAISLFRWFRPQATFREAFESVVGELTLASEVDRFLKGGYTDEPDLGPYVLLAALRSGLPASQIDDALCSNEPAVALGNMLDMYRD
jgi:hypothetical protein